MLLTICLFSYKGIAYEVGVCIATGKLVHVNGGFPAGAFNDGKIFDRDLYHKLEDAECVLGDSGYCDHPKATASDRYEANLIIQQARA